MARWLGIFGLTAVLGAMAGAYGVALNASENRMSSLMAAAGTTLSIIVIADALSDLGGDHRAGVEVRVVLGTLAFVLFMAGILAGIFGGPAPVR